MGKKIAYSKTEEEIELIRESSLLVGKTLAELAKIIQPGVTTLKLDTIAEEFIRDNGAVPGFKGYNNFPSTLCTSVNEQVVHGLPTDYELQDGDIVSVDCGVLKSGFYGDSAYTFEIGNVSPEVKDLLKRTKESLYKAIEVTTTSFRLGDIGYAVQSHTESFGYGVVRDLVGHGLGRDLHEEPQVPNHGKRGKGKKLVAGWVLAIEPMINLGTKDVMQSKDGHTIITKDHLPSTHFEHDVVVREGKAEVLSTFDYIEEVLQNKKN